MHRGGRRAARGVRTWRVTRILVEPGELRLLDSEDKATDALGLLEEIHRAPDNFGLTSPRLQHGAGEVAWVLLVDAVRRGLDTRIGLEDALYGPDGERTRGNEALVRAARELGGGHRLDARKRAKVFARPCAGLRASP